VEELLVGHVGRRPLLTELLELVRGDGITVDGRNDAIHHLGAARPHDQHRNDGQRDPPAAAHGGASGITPFRGSARAPAARRSPPRGPSRTDGTRAPSRSSAAARPSNLAPSPATSPRSPAWCRGTRSRSSPRGDGPRPRGGPSASGGAPSRAATCRPAAGSGRSDPPPRRRPLLG